MLPGTLFSLWGLWWQFAVAAARAPKFVTKPHWSLHRTQHMEAKLKMMLPLVGVAVELFAHPSDVRFRHPLDAGRWDQHSAVNWQHAAMYVAFAFSGALDVLTTRPAFAAIPAGVNWTALCGAFAIECMLFVFHVRMQSAFVADLHVLLVVLVVANAVAVLAASLMPSSITASMLVGYFMLAQGTWFMWQARVLYGPNRWDLTDTVGNELMLPVLFTFHLLLSAALSLSIALATAASYRRRDDFE